MDSTLEGFLSPGLPALRDGSRQKCVSTGAWGQNPVFNHNALDAHFIIQAAFGVCAAGAIGATANLVDAQTPLSMCLNPVDGPATIPLWVP